MAAGGRFRKFKRENEVPRNDNLSQLAKALRDPESEVPHDIACLDGACGPYVKSDRLEFQHLNRETQEWLARLSPDEVQDIRDAVSAFVRRRSILKWLKRTFWAAVTGFGAVYAAGEKLYKFVQYIGSYGFDPTLIWQALKGSFGL